MQYVNVITDVYFGLWSDVVVDDETRDYLVAIIKFLLDRFATRMFLTIDIGLLYKFGMLLVIVDPTLFYFFYLFYFYNQLNLVLIRVSFKLF
jgi:hypothetical protein